MKPLIFNGVSIYRNAIQSPKDFIDSIETTIKHEIDKSMKWASSQVVHADGSMSESSVRTNQFLVLPTSTGGEHPALTISKYIAEEIHKFFKPCIADFCTRFTVDAEYNSPTTYQILRYQNTQHYDAHLDDSKNTRRRVSAVGYLNDDFEGGELKFSLLNFIYYPTAGDIVVFPSGAPFTHEACPVKSGTKYSIVNWWN